MKSAYRRLAKQHHPDLGGDPEQFKIINEAYDVLSDANKRAHYDHQLKNPFGQHAHYNPFGHGESNPFDDIFQNFHFAFNQDAFQQQARQRNRNLRIVLEMDLLETIEEQNKIFDIRLSQGKETIEVKIPAGIQDGQILSLRGKGDNEFPSAPRGNLEIVIKVRPHDRFVRQDNNILTDVTIDCFDAVLGTDIQLDTPSGKAISMRIPAGTQNGAVFGISDEGFPTSPRFNRGKLLVRINTLIPKNLTPEQIILVREIQKKQPVNS